MNIRKRNVTFRHRLVAVALLVMAGGLVWSGGWREAGASRLLASAAASGDWPMWGGRPDRNMVSSMKGLPTSWDVEKKINVKWVAALGSQSYGNPDRKSVV